MVLVLSSAHYFLSLSNVSFCRTGSLTTLVTSETNAFSKAIDTGWDSLFLLFGGLLSPSLCPSFLLASIDLVARSLALSGHVGWCRTYIVTEFQFGLLIVDGVSVGSVDFLRVSVALKSD